MSRTSVLLAALLVAPACDRGASESDAAKTADAEAKGAAKGAAKAEAPPTDAEADPAPVDPWQAKLDARVLASSGLAEDGALVPFEIVNCEDGDAYCQICRFGRSPKLMAVGTVDDPAFLEDLKDLDAIAQKYGSDKLGAFAVITEIEGGKATTPKDVEEAKQRANDLREKLALRMPVVVPAPGDDGTNRAWDEYYNITRSRTVMFADGRNTVRYSAVGPDDFSELNEAIEAVVEG